jgi:hypothetical protein
LAKPRCGAYVVSGDGGTQFRLLARMGVATGVVASQDHRRYRNGLARVEGRFQAQSERVEVSGIDLHQADIDRMACFDQLRRDLEGDGTGRGNAARRRGIVVDCQWLKGALGPRDCC